MDVNNENEHIISSDEYSDEDDDDDALMTDAIRAQKQEERTNDYGLDKQSNWRKDQKQKELSSLIRRNKISTIYKKKSIKWLNSKWQRDRYKQRINQNAKNFNTVQIECPTVISLREKQFLSDDKNDYAVNIQGTVSVQKKDTNVNLKYNKGNIIEVNNTHHNTLSAFINHTSPVVNIQLENVRSGIVEKNLHGANVENIQYEKMSESTEKADNPSKRSMSSLLSNQSKESPEFDSGINNMFSKFDKISTNHVDDIAKSCLKSLDKKMENLSTEIDILNEVLHVKEKELNRLSYLKMVKEEIYFRLNRKRNTLQKSESFSDKQHQHTLLELEELEICLSDKKKSCSESYSSDTIQKLIENRASMSADDLEREKNNTSRLHSLLVSQNMLQATELLDKTCFARNVEKINIGLTNKKCKKNIDPDVEKAVNTKDRQEEVRNVESLIAEFKDKNLELFPFIGKRLKSTELNEQQEKNSRPQFFSKDNKSKFLSNSVNEISLTTNGCQKKMSSCLESVRLDNITKNKNKGNLNGKCTRSIQYPLCQECKTKESRFVCAGCGNQWYCSKNCQINAWDAHSDLCTE